MYNKINLQISVCVSMDTSWGADEARETIFYVVSFWCWVDFFPREKSGRQSTEPDPGRSPLFLWTTLSPAAFALVSLSAALFEGSSSLTSLLPVLPLASFTISESIKISCDWEPSLYQTHCSEWRILTAKD